MQYQPQKIERLWQRKWSRGHPKPKGKKGKYYILDMFPYPSGDGLHVGHVENFTATDIYARFKRFQGYEVIHPMGWDAFGLPAENFAIKTGIHPDKKTRQCIKNFTRQINAIGLSYDWEREINTSSSEYYRWTQWMFLLLYKNGLAYKKKAKVNWCASCQTVLANEQVVDGKCFRSGDVVVQKDLEQWFFKITDFVEDTKTKEGKKVKGLLSGLKKLDWPSSTKMAQANWIGRSEGAEVVFYVADSEEEIRVFTTRLDTIYGCTYVVVAPEHTVIQDQKSRIKNWEEVEKYLAVTKKKTDLERTELNKEKTGICLEGIEAVHPFTGKRLPVFVADYVLGTYGTAAVMGVPAHDERDAEFAKKYDLPIKTVILSTTKKHIVLIHGKGGPEDYLPWLKKKLEEKGYEVEAPILPNPAEPDDEEQMEYVIKNCKIDENTIILAHSFGGVIALRILERGYRANRVIFASMPFCGTFLDGKERPTVAAALAKGFHFEKIKKQVRDFVLLYDTGDQIVPVDDGKAYAKRLGTPVILVKAKTSHFDGIEEPELLKILTEDGSEDLFVEDGTLVNSEEFSGLTSVEAREKMAAWLKKEKLGKKVVNYRLRDWLISRQRYWGAPIPIIYCEKCGELPVPEKDLPVKLPTDVDFRPTGESPLVRSKSFHKVKCPKCGEKARRESDTMDTFVCSSWYYLRFADPQNQKAFASKKNLEKNLPVDFYMGGAEHTVLHLLYARFFTKMLAKSGYVNFDEPFTKLRHQGIILGEDGNKMSKSKGNVVNPDQVIEEFGADSLRLYEMFMGPLEEMKPWKTSSIVGLRRFLERVWKLQEKTGKQLSTISNKQIEPLLHKTIKKVTEDIESFKFNTAISSLMILVNTLEKEGTLSIGAYRSLLILLSPFAPHLTEELWERLGEHQSIFLAEWPKWDKHKIVEETMTIVVQVNGKVRERLAVDARATEKEIQEAALSSVAIAKILSGAMPKKYIFVPGRLINIVV